MFLFWYYSGKYRTVLYTPVLTSPLCPKMGLGGENKKVGGRNVGPHGSTTRYKTVFCSLSRRVEGNLNFFWRFFLRTRKSHIRSEKYGRVFEKGGGNKAVCWEKGLSEVRKWKHTSPAFPFSCFFSFVRVVYFLFYMPFFKAPFLVIPFFPAEKIFWEAFPFPYKIAQRSY